MEGGAGVGVDDCLVGAWVCVCYYGLGLLGVRRGVTKGGGG